MNEPPSSPVFVKHQWRMLDFNRENNWRCSAWFGALFSPSLTNYVDHFDLDCVSAN